MTHRAEKLEQSSHSLHIRIQTTCELEKVNWRPKSSPFEWFGAKNCCKREMRNESRLFWRGRKALMGNPKTD